MSEKELAHFTVRITSTKDATWQGAVSTPDGASFCFQSELQLLHWLCDRFPVLSPGYDPKDHTA